MCETRIPKKFFRLINIELYKYFSIDAACNSSARTDCRGHLFVRNVRIRLAEDFPAYIASKQVAICLQSSFVLFVILSIRGHGESKKE